MVLAAGLFGDEEAIAAFGKRLNYLLEGSASREDGRVEFDLQYFSQSLLGLLLKGSIVGGLFVEGPVGVIDVFLDGGESFLLGDYPEEGIDDHLVELPHPGQVLPALQAHPHHRNQGHQSQGNEEEAEE
jgi:hypothetical protein